MVELKSPDVITSISLWKYVATVSQLVDMDENEMGWLAKGGSPHSQGVLSNAGEHIRNGSGGQSSCCHR